MSKQITTLDWDHATEVFGDPALKQKRTRVINGVRGEPDPYFYKGMKKPLMELEIEYWAKEKLVETTTFYIDGFTEMYDKLSALKIINKEELGYQRFLLFLHESDALTIDQEDYKCYTFEVAIKETKELIEAESTLLLPRGI